MPDHSLSETSENRQEPYCEAKHCRDLAIGYVTVEGIRFLVCPTHARSHGIGDEEIEAVEEMWRRSEAATDCDQQHRTRSAS